MEIGQNSLGAPALFFSFLSFTVLLERKVRLVSYVYQVWLGKTVGDVMGIMKSWGWLIHLLAEIVRYRLKNLLLYKKLSFRK